MADYDDGYMWPQEHKTYDLVAYQDSVSFSGYEPYDLNTYDAYTGSEFREPKFIDHYHHPDDYYCDFDYSYTYDRPEINYCAQNHVEPKLIAYEPIACDTGYVSYHTQYSKSYSDMGSGFNEPEFEEYDPTPYGGGYDIVSVYGKPLPPSDQTCYPRSTPKSIQPKPMPDFEPEPKSKLKPEPTSKLQSESKPKPNSQLEPKSKPVPEPELVLAPTSIPLPEPVPEPVEVPEAGEKEREREECNYPDYGYDYPWHEYDHGYDFGVGYDYGYGKQMVQVPPCEYDPEVVDLCENIFGSWPCLARIRKQQMGIDNNPGNGYPGNGHHNPWEGCVNYIFGGPIVSNNQQGYSHGCEG